MIAWSTTPLAFALAGPLADQVFKPLLIEGGLLAGSVGRVIGVGPGRGVGLMIVLIGLCNVLAAAAGYLNPRVYHVEDELPDAIPHDEDEKEPALAPVEVEAPPASLAGE